MKRMVPFVRIHLLTKAPSALQRRRSRTISCALNCIFQCIITKIKKIFLFRVLFEYVLSMGNDWLVLDGATSQRGPSKFACVFNSFIFYGQVDTLLDRLWISFSYSISDFNFPHSISVITKISQQDTCVNRTKTSPCFHAAQHHPK